MDPVDSQVLTIGRYLLDRLYELGVEHIFGIPGDYVLRLDKLIEQHKIKFINATRENTAGQAADAYARMRGLGVACITYGVGINIVNALAQAYVESSPLVVISGAVGTDEFACHSTLHHLINKSSTAYADQTQLEIFKLVTVDQGVLDNPDTAASLINQVLNSCLQHKKPVYFEIPRNCIEQPLSYPPQNTLPSPPPINQAALQEALDETQYLLSSCRHPIIWVGHEILRFNLSQQLLQFAEQNNVPIVSSLLGKTVIDEHHPLFVGIYQGEMSYPAVSDLVERSDCILITGVLMSDFDTGFFTAKLNQERRIIANSSSLMIGHHYYPGVNLVDYIRGLQNLSLNRPSYPFYNPYQKTPPLSFKPIEGAKTTIKRVFECIQSHLKPQHILVTDIGDCLFASTDLILPYHSFIASAYFASLGFGTPAAIGAQIADSQKRVIAIVGDGGFQMSAMELSAAIRYNLDLIVIVLNNHGYGTERPLLEGAYNDIVNWNYTEIPRVLGGGIGIKADTETAFNEAMLRALAARGTFYLIEVELDKLDFSSGLQRLGELLSKIVRA